MSNTLNQSATERADALLTRWGQRLSPARQSAGHGDDDRAMRPEPEAGTVGQADSLLGRLGHRLSGRGLVEAAAYGYVALALQTGRAANTVQKTWQESVEDARRQQEQRAAQAGGPRAARRVTAEEKKGEQVLKQTEADVEGDAEQAADVAGSAAG